MSSTPSLASVWGESLRAARLAAGLTQVELAVRIGANQHTISRLENGAHRPSDPLKLALAGEFATTVEELFPYPKPTVAA
jgi:putative transcriptional regulator